MKNKSPIEFINNYGLSIEEREFCLRYIILGESQAVAYAKAFRGNVKPQSIGPIACNLAKMPHIEKACNEMARYYAFRSPLNERILKRYITESEF